MGLLDFYEELHKDDPALPDRAKVREENKQPKQEPLEPTVLPAVRSDNTSGYPGVHKKRNKWAARITYQKNTYQLGSYETIDGAITARHEAEKKLNEDPSGFAAWIENRRQKGKQEAE